MSIFLDEDKAWSAFTKSIEGKAGDPGTPLIVQAPTIFRPLYVRNVDLRLARFRKLLVADKIPSYLKMNSNDYVQSGKSVAGGYEQFLNELNNELRRRLVNANSQAEVEAKKTAYVNSQKALKTYVSDANKDWKKQKKEDPTLSRQQWDDDYGSMGYTPGLKLLQEETQMAYGAYANVTRPYPVLARVAEALYRLDNDARSREPLPTTEDDLQFPDSWETYLKCNIDVDWNAFFQTDSPDTLLINQSSSTSTHYEHRWSAGGSVSYGFFSIGGSASGGNIEDHLRSGSQWVKFAFQKLIKVPVIRGLWYDEGLISPYVDYVPKDEYWGPKGTLNLIPTEIVIGRGLTVEISTSQLAYDSFQSWHQQSGGAGFRFGPWAVGGSANSSTSSSSVTNLSSGTMIAMRDDSLQPYVIAVVSNKMDDFIASRDFLMEPSRQSEGLFLEQYNTWIQRYSHIFEE